MSAQPFVLIVEDEPSIADAVLYALKTEGFQTFHASTLDQAKSALGTQKPDLLILDVGLPDGTGFDFCKAIRAGQTPADRDLPVLFLTSRSSEIDRIVGLEIGGDDYVTKPFSPREVSARVKTILKRVKPPAAPAPSVIPSSMKSPDAAQLFRVDDEKKRIYFKNQLLELSRYEYGVLKLLTENPGRVYSRERLMELVWAEPEMSLDRTVDAHIKMLRHKLREIEPNEEFIVTHRGLGYSFKDSE